MWGGPGPNNAANPAANSPELLAVLLELRAQMEGVAEQLSRLDARVARIERVGRMRDERARVVPAACRDDIGAPSAWRVNDAPARKVRLVDLGPEMLALVAAALPTDDELAAKLACRALRGAVAHSMRARGAAHAGTRTRETAALGSIARLKWAVSCGMTLSPHLSAAQAGHLEVLKWLRANGCAWDRAKVLAVADTAVVAWVRAQPEDA
ncbi:hypothetical protein KFE25_010679 [Diacronema lutheri]|uniref:Uncharacterized protein n=1 Tax=Diacronema lutheri TaxID=2081491 RepID=A0A8J6CAY2_DIALT|nr:hypothetical protein KFE25_010679 [Diacronema lutheri]